MGIEHHHVHQFRLAPCYLCSESCAVMVYPVRHRLGRPPPAGRRTPGTGRNTAPIRGQRPDSRVHRTAHTRADLGSSSVVGVCRSWSISARTIISVRFCTVRNILAAFGTFKEREFAIDVSNCDAQVILRQPQSLPELHNLSCSTATEWPLALSGNPTAFALFGHGLSTSEFHSELGVVARCDIGVVFTLRR